MSFAAIAVGVVSAAVSAGMGMAQQSAANKAAGYTAEAAGRQAAQSEYEAKLIVEQSKEDARKVRSSAIKLRGSQVAAQAASGVIVGDGSSQAMLDEVSQLSEEDAVSFLMSGANGFISKVQEGRFAALEGAFQSKQLITQGRNAMIGGFAQAGTSLLGAYGKWQDRAPPPKTGSTN
jgi:hypothetical protein